MGSGCPHLPCYPYNPSTHDTGWHWAKAGPPTSTYRSPILKSPISSLHLYIVLYTTRSLSLPPLPFGHPFHHTLPPKPQNLNSSAPKSTRSQSPGLRSANTSPQQTLASQASSRLFSLETLVAIAGHSEPRSSSSHRPASVLKNQGPLGILGYIRLHAVANILVLPGTFQRPSSNSSSPKQQNGDLTF